MTRPNGGGVPKPPREAPDEPIEFPGKRPPERRPPDEDPPRRDPPPTEPPPEPPPAARA